MATYTPTTPIDHIGHGHKPPMPPAGGGDDGRGGGDVPNYGARLRRARLGLACGGGNRWMGVISLNSPDIVGRGGAARRGRSELWSKTAAGAAGTGLRDCDRVHGVHLADQRVYRAAGAADVRWPDEYIRARLGAGGFALAAAGD